MLLLLLLLLSSLPHDDCCRGVINVIIIIVVIAVACYACTRTTRRRRAISVLPAYRSSDGDSPGERARVQSAGSGSVRPTSCLRLRGRPQIVIPSCWCPSTTVAREYATWPGSPLSVVTTVVALRYGATVLFCSKRCDLEILNKPNMLVRTWHFLVRSIWPIIFKTIVTVLTWHPLRVGQPGN